MAFHSSGPDIGEEPTRCLRSQGGEVGHQPAPSQAVPDDEGVPWRGGRSKQGQDLVHGGGEGQGHTQA